MKYCHHAEHNTDDIYSAQDHSKVFELVSRHDNHNADYYIGSHLFIEVKNQLL